MAEKRFSKTSDQDGVERAYQILLNIMQDNPDIEEALWAGACWIGLINGYRENGVTYEEFCQEMNAVRKFFKDRW